MNSKISIVQIFFEKGNYTTAAETYCYVIHRKDSLNTERFYAQINELRTLYELDKSEMDYPRGVWRRSGNSGR